MWGRSKWVDGFGDHALSLSALVALADPSWLLLVCLPLPASAGEGCNHAFARMARGRALPAVFNNMTSAAKTRSNASTFLKRFKKKNPKTRFQFCSILKFIFMITFTFPLWERESCLLCREGGW